MSVLTGVPGGANLLNAAQASLHFRVVADVNLWEGSLRGPLKLSGQLGQTLEGKEGQRLRFWEIELAKESYGLCGQGDRGDA